MARRGVPNKVIGNNFVITSMTKCIHCTKCVRTGFALGFPTLGVAARGGSAEIYDHFHTSKQNKNRHELSGNIADVCPVSYKHVKMVL